MLQLLLFFRLQNIERINEASNNVQKVPGRTEAYWLNERTVLVKRSGILVALEKELIKNGLAEELRIAKLPLEQRVLQEVHLEEVLKRNITEIFLEWNFETDVSYAVFLVDLQR